MRPKKNEQAPCCSPTKLIKPHFRKKQRCKTERNGKSVKQCTTITGTKVCGEDCITLIGSLEALSEKHQRKQNREAMQRKKRKEEKVPTSTAKHNREGEKEREDKELFKNIEISIDKRFKEISILIR